MRAAIIAAIAVLGIVPLAAAPQAKAEIKHYELNIPRQALDMALKDFAQQTGLQVGRFSTTLQRLAYRTRPTSPGSPAADFATASRRILRCCSESVLGALHHDIRW